MILTQSMFKEEALIRISRNHLMSIRTTSNVQSIWIRISQGKGNLQK